MLQHEIEILHIRHLQTIQNKRQTLLMFHNPLIIILHLLISMKNPFVLIVDNTLSALNVQFRWTFDHKLIRIMMIEICVDEFKIVVNMTEEITPIGVIAQGQ